MENRELIEIIYKGTTYQVRRNQISALPFFLWSNDEVQKAIRTGQIKSPKIKKLYIKQMDVTRYDPTSLDSRSTNTRKTKTSILKRILTFLKNHILGKSQNFVNKLKTITS